MISWANVPDSVPTAVIVPVPSTNVVSIKYSSYVSVPTVVVLPPTVVSPVVVPLSWVTNVPAT